MGKQQLDVDVVTSDFYATLDMGKQQLDVDVVTSDFYATLMHS